MATLTTIERATILGLTFLHVFSYATHAAYMINGLNFVRFSSVVSLGK